ncbi:MAG TPA: hypothetical protein PLN38_04870 [Chitinophagales bacterium]|nr:hypothetical protein [Chitinophagales bacterium]
MTAKEKAHELVWKMHKVKTAQGVCYLTIHEAKKCAIIAVDEIFQVNPSNKVNGGLVSTKEYWQEVKNEIEKL